MTHRNHGKLLEIALIIKGISKGGFCELMGKDKNNYPNNFKKEKLNEGLLRDICKALEIDRTYFDTEPTSIIHQKPRDGTTDLKDLYERLLSEKDERLKEKEDKIQSLLQKGL